MFLRRARRKRDDGDDDEEEEEIVEEGPEDSDIEMEDAQAAPSSKKGRLRKKDALEEDVPKQSRAERLSARTQAKVRTLEDSCVYDCSLLSRRSSHLGAKRP